MFCRWSSSGPLEIFKTANTSTVTLPPAARQFPDNSRGWPLLDTAFIH
jgi:hypothetical protein